MSYQNAAQPAKGPRRKGLLALGIVLLVGGVGTGAGLFVASGSQYDEAVKNLQRAPVGCDTEFDFTGTGTFIFYTESKGAIGEIRGDCQNTETDYDHDGRIRATLTLNDDNGDEVDLSRKSGADYDTAGFVGTAIRSVDIDEPGTYTLSVESDDNDFAIAVGRDPKSDADSLRTVALIVAIAGLVLGLVLIILGLRRKTVPAAASPGGFGGFAPSPAPPFGTPGQFGTPGPFGTPGGPPPGGFGSPGPYEQPGPPMTTPPQPPPPGGPWGAPPQ
jgi:hypothetical protein